MIFLSPSYKPDLERFLLLRESIRRFCQTPAVHLVIVPSRDVAQFKARTRDDAAVVVLVQEDYVDARFYPSLWYSLVKRIQPVQRWRFQSFAGTPGWIVQQIVKLSCPAITKDPLVVIADSDCLFFRDFSERDFRPDFTKQLLVRRNPETESGMHRDYMEQMRHILRLPGSTDFHYMAYPAIFQRDWVIALHRHLEQIYSKPWQQVLCDAGFISEYLIYGLFVEEILMPDDLLVRTAPFNLGIWGKEFVGEFDQTIKRIERMQQEFVQDNAPICLTIQSNAGLAVSEYRERLAMVLNARYAHQS